MLYLWENSGKFLYAGTRMDKHICANQESRERPIESRHAVYFNRRTSPWHEFNFRLKRFNVERSKFLMILFSFLYFFFRSTREAQLRSAERGRGKGCFDFVVKLATAAAEGRSLVPVVVVQKVMHIHPCVTNFFHRYDWLSLSLSLPPVVERRRNLNYLCPFFWRKPSSIIDERERAVSSARIKRADVCVPAIIKNNVDVFVPCKICPRPRFLRYAGRIARFWSSPSSLLSRLSRPRATRQRRANYFRLLIDNSLLSPCHLSVPFSLSFLSLRVCLTYKHTCVCGVR